MQPLFQKLNYERQPLFNAGVSSDLVHVDVAEPASRKSTSHLFRRVSRRRTHTPEDS
jgi:hypothetical protein